MVSTENNKTYFAYRRTKYNGDDVFRCPIRRCHLRLISVKRLMEKYYCSYIWPSIFLLVVGDVLTKNSTLKDSSHLLVSINQELICIGKALQNVSLLSISKNCIQATKGWVSWIYGRKKYEMHLFTIQPILLRYIFLIFHVILSNISAYCGVVQ